MPKFKIKATELVETNVDFVSLVKRGANRIPFRITKEDEPMLDLHKIGRTLFAKAETKPEITAAVVPSGTDLNEVAKVFQEAGLETKAFVKSEGDGIVTLAKADADKAEGTAILKTGDKIGLVISGLKKAFDAYSGSSDFAEAVKAQNFYPSFYTAQEVLGRCVHESLRKAASPSEAAESISKSVADFQAYLTTLAATLPASAFYVDRYYSDLAKNEAPATEGIATADLTKADDAENKGKVEAEDEEDKAKAATQKTEETAEAAADTSAEQPQEVQAPEASVAENAELAALKKSQEDIVGAISELQKSVTEMVRALKEDVSSQMKDVNNRIEKVAEQARKTDAAINGFVFGEADGDQPARIEKSADDGLPPLLDTAYTPIDVAA